MAGQITLWSILAIGVLAAVYGVLLTVLAKPSGVKPKVARGFYVWPNTLSAVVAVLAVGAIVISRWPPSRLLVGVAGGLAIGWVLVFLLFFSSRATGRKLAVEGGGEGQSRLGYYLLSASGLLLGAAALLGVSIVVRARPALHIMTVEPFAALAVGFWLAATFWSLPSALYRWLLARETDVGPVQIGPLCVQFRSTPGETAFLAASGLACAAALAVYRFGGKNVFGCVYPLSAFAASLVFAALVSPIMAPAHGNRRASKRRAVLQGLGIGIFLAGTGLAAYLVAGRALGDLRAFYSFGVGLAAATFLMLTARYRPPFVPIGSPFGVEIAVAEVLTVLASAVLAFRWMAGYGVALCTVGMLSSLAVVFPIGALWAAQRAGEGSEEVDLPFIAHAASRFAEMVMAGGAFLLLVALFRLFVERAELRRAGIDISDPYPFIGLVVGGSFPILLRALSQSGRIGESAATFDKSVLTSLGRWAAFRTLGIWLLAGITPLLVGFFWRIQAAGAFLVGLAAAELFLILTLWLGEVRNTADEGIRVATRATHILSVGSGLITVLLVPPLIEFTGGLTRAVKIKSLVGVLAVLLVWVLVVVWRRLKAEKE
ncbi:MAG TPA: hypothetical protein VMX94_03685 [Armatimonadota bacterium]|nr:hypothetical protein [Armatimonadota bacterium]